MLVDPRAPADSPLVAVGFADLELSWKPALASRYWPNESLPLEIRVSSTLLREGQAEPPAWARELFGNLTCKAELRTQAGRVLSLPDAQRVDPLDPRTFRLPLEFTESGRFDLHITMQTRPNADPQPTDILHVTQPVFVEDRYPIVLYGYREREGQPSELVFSPESKGTGSLKIGDVLVLRAVPAGPDVVIKAITPAANTSPAFRFEGPAKPLQDPPGAIELRVFIVQTPDRAELVPINLIATVERKPEETVSRLNVPGPGIRISEQDIRSTVAIMSEPLEGQRLFVGEEVEWPFIVRANHLSREQVEALEKTVKVIVEDPQIGSLGAQEALAERIEIRPASSQNDRAWDVRYHLWLKPYHLSREGLYSYRVLRPIALQKVEGEGKLKVIRAPVSLALGYGKFSWRILSRLAKIRTWLA